MEMMSYLYLGCTMRGYMVTTLVFASEMQIIMHI